MNKVSLWIMVAILITGMILSGGLMAQAVTINVPGDHGTIQAAINAANNGDEVLVAAGTYNELINFNGKAITVRTNEGATIDGSGLGDSVVTFSTNETSGSILDGFNVINGLAHSGGGIDCYYSSPSITNCIINNNNGYNDGGGIRCNNSSATITNCTISGNFTDNYGGGIECVNASPIISNCTINNNTSLLFGGGIYCGSSSSPTVDNCIINSNQVDETGGGVFIHSSSLSITNSIISNNTANYYSGGIECNFASLTMSNCMLNNNEARVQGGAITCNYSTLKGINSTLSDNTAGTWGGGVFVNYSSQVTMVNSILWDNTVDGIPNDIEFYDAASSITITYSDINSSNIIGPGSKYLSNNINEVPLFIGGGDYHLNDGSPCIDAGTLNGAPEYDFEGDPRFVSAGGDDAPDMGADEYHCFDEVCDGIDNDCDGEIDEDFDVGASCIVGVGECENSGSMVCTADELGTECDAVPGIPSPENCSDGLDNDCDSAVDNADPDCWECVPGTARACYTGDPANRNVGECQDGTEDCVNGFWDGQCDGEVLPAAENCGDNLDNDCDSVVDNADPDCWECVPGTARACFTGDPANQNVGECQDGTEDCVNGFWDGQCDGEVLPSCDIKNNTVDEDCNGSDRTNGRPCPGGGGGSENCIDGQDNDGDGDIDCADRDCRRDPACSSPTEVCDDFVDNDGDGDVDCDDRDCRKYPACSTENKCRDGIDNDGDGPIDCADPDCAGKQGCL